MPHLLELNEEQHNFLGAADADAAHLSTLLAASRMNGLASHEWLTVAALASGIADRMDQLVEAADTDAAREPWATSVRLIRDSAQRHELRAAPRRRAAMTDIEWTRDDVEPRNRLRPGVTRLRSLLCGGDRTGATKRV